MSITDERRWILKLGRDGGYELAWATESKTEGWWLSADQVETMFAEWQASRTPEAAPSDTDREALIEEALGVLAEGVGSGEGARGRELRLRRILSRTPQPSTQPKCEHGIALSDLCMYAERVANEPSTDQTWREAAQIVLAEVKINGEPALEFIDRIVAATPTQPSTVTEARPAGICAECGCVGYHAINCLAARLTPAHPEQVTGVLAEIQAEVVRSTEKHGDQNHLPLGTAIDVQPLLFCGDEQTAENLAQQAKFWTDDRSHSQGDGTVTWRDILTEEVFEAYAESDPVKLRAELVQVAAVTVKIINAIDAAAVTPESGEKR